MSGPRSTLGDGKSTAPRLRRSPFTPGLVTFCPRDKLRFREVAVTAVGERGFHVGVLSLGKYEIDDCRRDFEFRAVGGGVDNPETVGEGHEELEGELQAIVCTLPSTSCRGLGPDSESGRICVLAELIAIMKGK